MTAVVPLNVAAVRVSNADQTNVTSGFKGLTAAFDQLPWQRGSKLASTGDTIMRSLETQMAAQPLAAGVHLHWELPDAFKRGEQDPSAGAVTFPAAPNRWLVVRSLTVADPTTGIDGPVQCKAWVVESDFLSATLQPDGNGIVRPAISVPITSPSGAPFMYMGRVVDAATWTPGPASNYLPAYKAPDGTPLYLTAIGFVGPGFSAYYPDCRSVFGFWDTFADQPTIATAIANATKVEFTVSYQVIGWLADAAADPLPAFASAVTSQYNTYVQQCAAQKVAVAQTPTDVYVTLAKKAFGWTFQPDAITFTLNADKTLASLGAPQSTLVAGVAQQIEWNQLNPSSDTPYLAPPQNAPSWTAPVDVAIGNTTIEAVSALVRSDPNLPPPSGSGVLSSYELLLDALQLGLLPDIEGQGNALITLDETRHTRAFARHSGGLEWAITQQPKNTTPTPGQPAPPAVEVTLPLPLAEQLHLLNVAQRAYDQARDAVALMRQQLFMDWLIYVKQLVGQTANPVVSTNDLVGFLTASSSGELATVQLAGAAAGIVHYQLDPETKHVIGVSTTDTGTAASAQLCAAYAVVASALGALSPTSAWTLDATPAAPFWLPTDPVLVMEGDQIEPARRNGQSSDVAVRVDTELIASLGFAVTSGSSPSWTVAATQLGALVPPPPTMTAPATAATLIGEAALLMPMQAPAIGALVAAQGGQGNPAVSNLPTFVQSLQTAQGGSSPLAVTTPSGLYAEVHAPGAALTMNPTVTVSAPSAITVAFMNVTSTAWVPDPVGWNAQVMLTELSPTRADPFLPVWLVWSLRLDPLAPGNGTNYVPTTMSDRFELDDDAVDYSYLLSGSQPAPGFTTGQPVVYSGAVALSKRPFDSLTQQIDRYLTNFPNDAADVELTAARDELAKRRVMSQALGGFGPLQTLRTTIPQIPVMDLAQGGRDAVTTQIAAAAVSDPQDSWYATAFNGLAPVSTGVLADYNFGPLRSGFLEVLSLAIIDAFGQIMQLSTPLTASGAMTVTPAIDLQPLPADTTDVAKIYLPPRPLVPSRLDFSWLSARHDPIVAGFTHDFVEMNSHPATSPVCGWLMPNHLDVTLMFYDADGSAIGSFGIEHGVLTYRTRAGNTKNPTSDLATDLVSVNPHVADFMRFVNAMTAGFLTDLMSTIARSDAFINPASYAQDAALAVLVGRPLALTRAVIGMSTAGALLPLSQVNTSTSTALALAVKNGWTGYAARQAQTSAALGGVTFPVRLGDLANIDDGLVGFLLDGAEPTPYAKVFAPTAPVNGTNGVVQPGPGTITVTLNGTPVTVTMLVDPRAMVHATTGVLPVSTALIPPDQYSAAMASLAVSFTTNPVLRAANGFSLPLPDEHGYAWSWVAPAPPTAPPNAPVPLPANAGSDTATYGYSPQHLAEGWLVLAEAPAPVGVDQ